MSLLTNVGIGITAYLDEINDLIGSLLSPSAEVRENDNDLHPEWMDYTGFKGTERAIRGSFCCPFKCGGCGGPLTWDIIFTRLVIIDSLWSTNTRMGFFVKENVATAIWNACLDSNGLHTDAALATKADEYVQWAINKGPKTQGAAEVENLFAKKYECYVDSHHKTITGRNQLSLLTKYLHFLVETQMPQNTIGFPIYDNIVQDILPKVCRLVGLTGCKCNSIHEYTNSLYLLITKLQSRGNVWRSITNMTPYHIIDRFLWTLGKVRQVTIKQAPNTTLSYLVSQVEFKNMVSSVSSYKISPRLQKWDAFLKNHNTIFK